MHTIAGAATLAFVTSSPTLPPVEPEALAISVALIEAMPAVETPQPEPQPAPEEIPEPEAAEEPVVPVEETADELPQIPQDQPENDESATYELAAIPIPSRRPDPAKSRSLPTRPNVSADTAAADAQAAREVASIDQTATQTSETLATNSHGEVEERWQRKLLVHLERHKRYPARAASRRQEGTVLVRFMVRPDGSVAFAEMVQSSGVPLLDEEVMALLQRAAPVPRPPEGINAYVSVPVTFNVRR